MQSLHFPLYAAKQNYVLSTQAEPENQEAKANENSVLDRASRFQQGSPRVSKSKQSPRCAAVAMQSGYVCKSRNRGREKQSVRFKPTVGSWASKRGQHRERKRRQQSQRQLPLEGFFGKSVSKAAIATPMAGWVSAIHSSSPVGSLNSFSVQALISRVCP